MRDVVEVHGAPESKQKGVRSGDYRFVLRNGEEIKADLYQPEADKKPDNIHLDIIKKSDQASVVVVELKNPEIGLPEAHQIAKETFRTPNHNINRLIFIKNDNFILDISKRSR